MWSLFIRSSSFGLMSLSQMTQLDIWQKNRNSIQLGFLRKVVRQNDTYVTSLSMQLKKYDVGYCGKLSWVKECSARGNEWMNEWIVYFLFSKNYYGEKRTWTITQWLYMEIIYTVNYNFQLHGKWRHISVILPDDFLQKTIVYYYQFYFPILICCSNLGNQ